MAEAGQPARDGREAAILDCLRARGASFFGPLHDAVGGGYPGETVDALWHLVWKGLITNDTVHALRGFTRARTSSRRRARRSDVTAFRSRRLAPPSAEGRWTLVLTSDAHPPKRPAQRSQDATKWAAAVAQQLLARYGVLTRESVAAESIPGGFGAVYPVLKAMEDAGRVRRGYFVAGLGAMQFALPGGLDLLRSLRDGPDEPEIAVLSATDPASPYGATLKWPAFAASTPVDAASARQAPVGTTPPDTAGSSRAEAAKAARGPTRTVGATVVLVDGALAAYLARGDRLLLTFLPDAEPARSKVGDAVASALIERARAGGDAPRGMLIEEIDGLPPSTHPMAPYLVDAGFIPGAMGLRANLKI